MNIRDVGKTAVVDIAKEAITTAELKEIEKLLQNKASNNRVAINLKNVRYIDFDFINLLKNNANKNKLSLINVNTDIYLMLFVHKADIYTDLYLDEFDFVKEKNSIVYRRLKVLKTA